MKIANKVDMNMKMMAAVFGAGFTHLEDAQGNVTKAGSLPALSDRAEKER